MREFDLGLLGGGQLARMTIQAAQRMGLLCLSVDPGEVTPASQVAASIVGALDDVSKVSEIFRRCERVTLENEFIPAATIVAAMELAARGSECMTPGTECLATVQDKLLQRRAYAANGTPSPAAVSVGSDGSDRSDGSVGIEFPVVLKARFGGYDGKGTRYARNREEFESHRELWSGGGWMAEPLVDFRREVAVMVCRSESGTVCFPTMETVQADHVCDVVMPAQVDGSEVAVSAVEALGGYGLFGVEMFETLDGGLLVNEVAPRPHNSGHYTLDWGGPSQFEAHVRLSIGLPVEPPRGQDACMANLLGQQGAGDFRAGVRAAIGLDPGAHVHWYGKAEAREGRKMGHLTVVGERCVARAERAREAFYKGWCGG